MCAWTRFTSLPHPSLSLYLLPLPLHVLSHTTHTACTVSSLTLFHWFLPYFQAAKFALFSLSLCLEPSCSPSLTLGLAKHAITHARTHMYMHSSSHICAHTHMSTHSSTPAVTCETRAPLVFLLGYNLLFFRTERKSERKIFFSSRSRISNPRTTTRLRFFRFAPEKNRSGVAVDDLPFSRPMQMQSFEANMTKLIDLLIAPNKVLAVALIRTGLQIVGTKHINTIIL